MENSGILEQSFKLTDEAATEHFGQSFAEALKTSCHSTGFAGLQIHLRGALGAGKTALVRAALRALGVGGQIRSPTYTLVEHYTVQLSTSPSKTTDTLDLYHFDLYRFTHPVEWIEAGFQEYLSKPAVCWIEWPERAKHVLKQPDLVLALKVMQEGRLLTTRAYSPLGTTILRDVHA